MANNFPDYSWIARHPEVGRADRIGFRQTVVFTSIPHLKWAHR